MLKHILDHWDSVKNLAAGKDIGLFLDYDGTLTPIVESPIKAILPQENKELLGGFVKIPSCHLAIVSGRALLDIKGMVDVHGIDFIGNHGWEIEGEDIRFESLLSPQFMSIIERIKYEIEAKLSAVNGTFVEDKRATLSIHHRLVSRDQVPVVHRTVHDICKPYIKQKQIKINLGKEVLEIKPPVEWDKGKAVLWLLKKRSFICGEGNILPIYIGDDTTDEDAFKVLKHKGVTIFVGSPEKISHAEYYVEKPQGVTEFLRRLLAEKMTCKITQ
jgi:trehalose 6-phosphate phosphatase